MGDGLYDDGMMDAGRVLSVPQFQQRVAQILNVWSVPKTGETHSFFSPKARARNAEAVGQVPAEAGRRQAPALETLGHELKALGLQISSTTGRPEMFGPRRWDRERVPAYDRQYGSSGHQKMDATTFQCIESSGVCALVAHDHKHEHDLRVQ